jgi:hypothetical protein
MSKIQNGTARSGGSSSATDPSEDQLKKANLFNL